MRARRIIKNKRINPKKIPEAITVFFAPELSITNPVKLEFNMKM